MSITESPEDSITITAIDDYTNIETTFDIKENFVCYPNPSESLLNVKFYLVSEQAVTLSIYSITGIRTADLIRGILKQGAYDDNFNIKDIISNKGTYILKLNAGQEVYISKVILN